MPLGRIRARPSCIVPAQPACAARALRSLARLGLGQRSVRGPRHACTAAVTGRGGSVTVGTKVRLG
jgi:hypothetical protein